MLVTPTFVFDVIRCLIGQHLFLVDINMLGHSYDVFIGGNSYSVDGTSASAPVFAGVLALVNNRRIADGKSSVGWATPALYGLHSTDSTLFNDVTSGANNCCGKGQSGQATVCCTAQGFYAGPGWDPLTGLGSVNVGRVLDAWAAL